LSEALRARIIKMREKAFGLAGACRWSPKRARFFDSKKSPQSRNCMQYGFRPRGSDFVHVRRCVNRGQPSTSVTRVQSIEGPVSRALLPANRQFRSSIRQTACDEGFPKNDPGLRPVGEPDRAIILQAQYILDDSTTPIAAFAVESAKVE